MRSHEFGEQWHAYVKTRSRFRNEMLERGRTASPHLLTRRTNSFFHPSFTQGAASQHDATDQDLSLSKDMVTMSAGQSKQAHHSLGTYPTTFTCLTLECSVFASLHLGASNTPAQGPCRIVSHHHHHHCIYPQQATTRYISSALDLEPATKHPQKYIIIAQSISRAD